MKQYFSLILTLTACLAAAAAILFGLSYFGMVSKSFFGKWNEEIRYDIHKESQAYRDGMQRTLMQYQTEYLSASGAGRSAIKATIRHQFSQTDVSEFPAHLRDFLRNEIGIY